VSTARAFAIGFGLTMGVAAAIELLARAHEARR
jgi:hypothetical protein